MEEQACRLFPFVLRRKEGIQVNPNDLSDLWKQKKMTKSVFTKVLFQFQLMSLGAIGCYLSHYELWKECATMNEPFVIFEDDVVFHPNLIENVNGLLQSNLEFDMIHLGQIRRHSTTPTLSKIIRLKRPFDGMFGYILHPRFAKKMLPILVPIQNHIDIFLARKCKYETDLIYCFTENMVTTDGRWKRDSDILLQNDHHLSLPIFHDFDEMIQSKKTGRFVHPRWTNYSYLFHQMMDKFIYILHRKSEVVLASIPFFPETTMWEQIEKCFYVDIEDCLHKSLKDKEILNRSFNRSLS